MSFYDARFHHTFQCLSLNVKDQNWERDLAEHEVWLPNWRRHQAKAGAVRALGRGSRLRIPRRRASPMLKSSWASASIQGWLVNIFCAWLKWDYDSPKCTPFVPLRGRNKYKKKILSAVAIYLRQEPFGIYNLSPLHKATIWETLQKFLQFLVISQPDIWKYRSWK